MTLRKPDIVYVRVSTNSYIHVCLWVYVIAVLMSELLIFASEQQFWMEWHFLDRKGLNMQLNCSVTAQ